MLSEQLHLIVFQLPHQVYQGKNTFHEKSKLLKTYEVDTISNQGLVSAVHKLRNTVRGKGFGDALH